MSDIYLDIEQATIAMRSVLGQARERAEAHRALAPAFPVVAAGSGFAGHAARLQAVFVRVHDAGAARIAAVGETAQSALDQFLAVAAADATAADSFAASGTVRPWRGGK